MKNILFPAFLMWNVSDIRQADIDNRYDFN